MNTPASSNWIPNPHPLTEAEIKLDITWTADAKTAAALERQAHCNEFASVKDYLLDLIVTQLLGDEQDTVLTNDGKFVSAVYALDENLSPRNL